MAERIRLFEAIRKNNSSVATQLIARLDLNLTDEYGNTALHIASLKSRYELSMLLLENGADINIRNKEGYSPIDYAYKKGRHNIANLFLEKYSESITVATLCRSLLYIKDPDKRNNVIKHITEKVFSSIKANSKNTILSEEDKAVALNLFISEGSYDLVSILSNSKDKIICNTDIRPLPKFEINNIDWIPSPLSVASSSGNLDIFKLILTKVEDINIKDNLGKTPLHLACETGNIEIVNILLIRGSSIYIKDKNGNTPLSEACAHNHIDIVQLLIDQGASVDSNMLQRACDDGYFDIVQLLVNNGAHINIKDDYSCTPLEIAVSHNYKDITMLLLDNGADVQMKHGKGELPINIAIKNKFYGLVELLVSRGATVNSRNEYGNLPIIESIKDRDFSMVSTLINNGANLFLEDQNGEIPFFLLKELLVTFDKVDFSTRSNRFIMCNSCYKFYKLPDGELDRERIKVRCKCGHSFIFRPSLINNNQIANLPKKKKLQELEQNFINRSDEFSSKGQYSCTIPDGYLKKRTTISASVRREVWRRDQGKCTECGSREKLEYDHIIPVSKGGSNTVRNIELLCESCNRKKSNKIS